MLSAGPRALLRSTAAAATTTCRAPSSPAQLIIPSPPLASYNRHRHLSRRSGLLGAGVGIITLVAAAVGIGTTGAASSSHQQQQQTPVTPVVHSLQPSAQRQHSSGSGSGTSSGASSSSPPPSDGVVDTTTTTTADATTTTMMGSSTRASQAELVAYLERARLVKSPRVAVALRAVDRYLYTNHAFAGRADSYQDHPLAIGEGQTISAPHMHAICLELLEPHLRPGARVLDVGSGSGYLTACLAKLVEPGGFVLGVDKVPELVAHARAAVAAANPELLAAAPAPLLKLVHGNALSDLLDGEAPFDAIHVGAAADELHPLLLDKLRPGGRMVIPVGPRYSYQVLMAVDKDERGGVRTQQLLEVGYVPLLRPNEHEGGVFL